MKPLTEVVVAKESNTLKRKSEGSISGGVIWLIRNSIEKPCKLEFVTAVSVIIIVFSGTVKNSRFASEMFPFTVIDKPFRGAANRKLDPQSARDAEMLHVP